MIGVLKLYIYDGTKIVCMKFFSNLFTQVGKKIICTKQTTGVCVCVALSSGIHKALIKKTALNLRLTLFSPASSTLETIRINFMVTVASFYRREFVSLNFKFSQNSLTVFVEEPRMSYGGGGERFPDIFEGFFLLLL